MKPADLYPGFDEVSYQLGIIDAFCEMVAAGVKGLALSHPLAPEVFAALEKAAGAIAAGYGVENLVERDFVRTDFSPDSVVSGKVVILLYKDSRVADEYARLKDLTAAQERQGSYNAAQRKEATLALCRLLGYPQAKLDSLYPDG